MAAATKPEINKTQAIRDYLKQNPKAQAKEAVAALAKEGFTVTVGHVYVVKGNMKLTQKRKAKATAMAATAGSNGSAAKKIKAPASTDAPNKSQAVRELLTHDLGMPVSAVISTLAARGIDVKKGLVYFVKGSMKSKKRRQVKQKVAAEMAKTTRSASSDGAADALATIKQIKGLASELGGMKKLKALVDALSE